ncbi:uncharacterized protein SPPG_06439 [Spizellomyces punctatus DAOM BR117]|uniref:Uncharacterized protein n=1 Tax=Spizellomyces punctatus (strain DAOM BR117) TaxID=645134 RepID=A0A0L0H909_SPIPD|nr:uncharacterized protein SPPG_06439 [Spizellomyces punctatus DAOM BR117]KNC98020.1 hypothetical protein SPPG_06439 [Spizellomyces punctatus DAOM BR117]|eukprot:XP_016606060.1 hypothetical protein SPPG_06439 [Spizellomyces punctatus DAOM BR117]
MDEEERSDLASPMEDNDPPQFTAKDNGHSMHTPDPESSLPELAESLDRVEVLKGPETNAEQPVDDDDVPLARPHNTDDVPPAQSEAHQSVAAIEYSDDDDDIPLAQTSSSKTAAPILASDEDDDVPLVNHVASSSSQHTSSHQSKGKDTQPITRPSANATSSMSSAPPASSLAPSINSRPYSDDDEDIPLSQYTGSDRASSHRTFAEDDRPLSEYTQFSDRSSYYQTPTSTFRPASSLRSYDSHIFAHLDNLVSSRIAPFVAHIQRLEQQVQYLTAQLAEVQEHARHYGPQVQLGPGKFLAQVPDPALELSKKVSKALTGLAQTNPIAAPKPATLGSGLVAGMPVKVHYVESGESGYGGGATGAPHFDLASERVVCPKCQGKGWEHGSPSKHKTATNVRCKKCTDCHECGGSGMIFDKNLCETCEARGFSHTDKTSPHEAPSTTTRCPTCTTCPTCKGRGLTEAPPILAAEASSQELLWKRKSYAMGALPKVSGELEAQRKSLAVSLDVGVAGSTVGVANTFSTLIEQDKTVQVVEHPPDSNHQPPDGEIQAAQ